MKKRGEFGHVTVYKRVVFQELKNGYGSLGGIQFMA